MGLKDFLIKQGFITETNGDSSNSETSDGKQQPVTEKIAPTFFPVRENNGDVVSNNNQPDFVTSINQPPSVKDQIDPGFIKFFEDELVKSNLPGPDYFEFRQLLNKTQQKMEAKGMASPEVVLHTVLMSFEAQDVNSTKLIEAALRYKEILKRKRDEFLAGAVAEKNSQLQKRQAVIQGHEANIQKMLQQLQQLELQKRQLEDALEKAKTQSEVDKTMGKEGIAKIERAERLIDIAHEYMQGSIDADIQRLQNP